MSCATPNLLSGPLGHVPETAGHVAEIVGHDPETAGHLHPKYAVPVPSAAQLWAIAPHLLYMGPIAGFVAILFWNLGNRMLTPLNGVLFMDVLPITTFAVSALTGVLPGRMQIVGACMTGAALILNNVYLRRRARHAQAAR